MQSKTAYLTARPWAERGSCSAPGLFYYFFFNRAAMGRARFLLCTWFISFFLTARPWAERGSCSAPGLFFNRAAMGRTRFLLYRYFIFFNRAAMGRTRFLLYRYFIYLFFNRGSCSAAGLFFYLFFFCFVGDQTQTSTRPNRQRDFKSRNC